MGKDSMAKPAIRKKCTNKKNGTEVKQELGGGYFTQASPQLRQSGNSLKKKEKAGGRREGGAPLDTMTYPDDSAGLKDATGGTIRQSPRSLKRKRVKRGDDV